MALGRRDAGLQPGPWGTANQVHGQRGVDVMEGPAGAGQFTGRVAWGEKRLKNLGNSKLPTKKRENMNEMRSFLGTKCSGFGCLPSFRAHCGASATGFTSPGKMFRTKNTNRHGGTCEHACVISFCGFCGSPERKRVVTHTNTIPPLKYYIPAQCRPQND